MQKSASIQPRTSPIKLARSLAVLQLRYAHPEERDLDEELGHSRRRLLPGALEDRADERADHFVRYLREGTKFGLAWKEDFVRIQILGNTRMYVFY